MPEMGTSGSVGAPGGQLPGATRPVLLLFDGDGEKDCPEVQAPVILGWVRTEALNKPCAVVMAYREYEAWFLASIESLRGQRGIRADAESHPNPEQPKGAKGQLEARMEPARSYHETADQPALTGLFDLALTYQRCRSFQHLVKVFGELCGGRRPGPGRLAAGRMGNLGGGG